MKVSRAWSQLTAWFLAMLIKCFVLVDFWWCLWRNARRWWILAHTFLLRCFQWSFVDLCQTQWSWSPQRIAPWFLVDLRRTWFRSQSVARYISELVNFDGFLDRRVDISNWYQFIIEVNGFVTCVRKCQLGDQVSGWHQKTVFQVPQIRSFTCNSGFREDAKSAS